MAAGLAVAAMVSVVIGAWLGLTFHASEKLIANILAFGSGALVNALAIDLAYGTTDTPFTGWAREQGAGRVAQGLGMLVEQAAEAFFLWRGVRPDTESIRHELQA